MHDFNPYYLLEWNYFFRYLTPHLHCKRLWCITAATRFYSVLHAVPTHTGSISEAERVDARDHVICLSDVFFLDFWISTIQSMVSTKDIGV